MLIFEERGKPEYPEKNLSVQERKPAANSTHIAQVRKSKPSHIGGRRVLSPLRHPCSPQFLFRYSINPTFFVLELTAKIANLHYGRFGRGLSPRYRRGFDHVRNFTQLGGDVGKKCVESRPDGNEIAASLHLRISSQVQGARKKLRQKSHKTLPV